MSFHKILGQVVDDFILVFTIRMTDSSKPHFFLPPINDFEGGWGPASDVVPEQFRDIPYAPFSKSDKLGRVADWTNPEGQKQDNRETTGGRQRTGFNRFNKGNLKLD